MKILVVSDSHGSIQGIRDAIFVERPDYLVHLGDCCGDLNEIRAENPMLPMVAVRGNCDLYDMEQSIRIAEYCGVRIMITHGHLYGVKNGLLRLELAAREKKAEVILFGHTHQAYCDNSGGLWMMNPGSCGGSIIVSYGIVEIKDQVATCSVKRL